ncbi:hypothetical protein FOA52_011587 [Chlamydomonas sp. UWO 241]|nr:hypothetical protein FOA52_011587 [Chlamydomonas sp. UWO 241]
MTPVPRVALRVQPLGPTTCVTIGKTVASYEGMGATGIGHLSDGVMRLKAQLQALGDTGGELNSAASAAFPQHAQAYGECHRRIEIRGAVVVQSYP